MLSELPKRQSRNLAGRCSCGIATELGCQRCGKCPCEIDVLETALGPRICVQCRPVKRWKPTRVAFLWED